MKNSNIFYRLALILASVIWGFAFAFQAMGLESMGAFYFNGIRMFIAMICLIPVIIVYNKFNPKAKDKMKSKAQYIAGILCGLVLGIASALQQYGLYYTEAGKSSFITALYILLVPIFGILLKKKAGVKVWIAAIIAVIGMYFLCISGSTTINFGDILTFFCAIFFALQILIIDHYGEKIHPIMLSLTQFFIAGIVSTILGICTETITWTQVEGTIIPLLYAGAASGAVAYTLQIIGQRKTPPALASILMSGESVFGAIGGFFILGQKLSIREIFGCILMFTAIILAQLPNKK